MADKSYDVVIVGAGNKALVTAMYLTKYGGLSVGMFEERHELGAGWSSEEPSPGFAGNTCSNNHMAWYHVPIYKDFPEFVDYGARYAHTSTTVGTVFDDDSCILQFSAYPDVDPTQEKTAELISRFSKKDADTYLEMWNNSINHWYPAMMEWAFTPAKPVREPDAMDRLFMSPDTGVDPHWLLQNPVQLFGSVFEDPHLQVWFHRVIQSWGIAADEPGAGWPALMAELVWLPFSCYVMGGTHALTHAAYRIIYENGGEAFTNKKVDEILIENGKAKGIRLADGTEVEAKLAVMASVDPYQLVFDLIGAENLDPIIPRKVKLISRDWIAIIWYSWAFTERPKWKCEDFEPAAKYCQDLCFGASSYLDVNAFIKESSERRAGIWPTDLNTFICYMGESDVDTFDQCMGPPDTNFKILSEQFVLPAWRLSDAEWKMREKEYAEEFVKLSNRYAPNVTWDNIAGYVPVTPYYTKRFARNFGPAGNWGVIDNSPSQIGKFRPIPELAGNRVPGIKGLYCTGTAWHPFAIATSAQGYNCYKVMAEDLDLKETWEGRQF